MIFVFEIELSFMKKCFQGKFELQDVIAAGGYGQIYKAVDTVRQETVLFS